MTDLLDLMEAPLDELKTEDVEELLKRVFDQEAEEEPVPVARFGSGI